MRARNEDLHPDFIGIGAARSGTTWIFKNLESHPDVWMPRIKELHYFTRSSKYFGPSHLEDCNVFRRFFFNADRYVHYRRRFFQSLGSNVLKPSWSKLKWDARYLFGRPSDEWYFSLFKEGLGKTKGEITPRYCILDEEDIQCLHRLLPKVKIVFMMRNPIERVWSLICYHEIKEKKPLSSMEIQQLIEVADHPAKRAQNEYGAILRRWQSVFPKDQFFVGFYDEIRECPVDLLKRLAGFLQIDYKKFRDSMARSKAVFNASSEKKIPAELREHLKAIYQPKLREWTEEYGGHFKKWQESMK